jgi:nicotinamidase-related amidase
MDGAGVSDEMMRVTPSERSVLLLVDVQNGFVNSASAHVVPVIERLAQRWQLAGGPVVATRFHNPAGGNWERLLDWHLLKERPEVDLVPEVAALDPVTIDKTSYTSFTDEFVVLQKENRWDNVVLCGIDTDICVLKTAVDAFEMGLTPIVLADAIASHAGAEAHRAGLAVLTRFIGKRQITTTQALDLG